VYFQLLIAKVADMDASLTSQQIDDLFDKVSWHIFAETFEDATKSQTPPPCPSLEFGGLLGERGAYKVSGQGYATKRYTIYFVRHKADDLPA